MPLTYYFFFIYIIACQQLTFSKSDSRFLLVINPAGNVRDPGRNLSDSFERGATLQCAEMLKKKLEQPENLEVILTRTAGSNSSQEQNAQIANRLNANLYLYLSFFHEIEVKPRLFLYTFSYDNDFPLKVDSFLFCPYDQAHCIALEKTAAYAKIMHSALTLSPYAIHQVWGIPYAPLKGIIYPAIGIEIGLHTTRDWRECIPFITQSINTLVTTINA